VAVANVSYRSIRTRALETTVPRKVSIPFTPSVVPLVLSAIWMFPSTMLRFDCAAEIESWPVMFSSRMSCSPAEMAPFCTVKAPATK
jgi:hypothetical protein